MIVNNCAQLQICKVASIFDLAGGLVCFSERCDYCAVCDLQATATIAYGFLVDMRISSCP
jgi:hypothetical protein